MRFAHLSDLHIGIRLHDYDLQEEQRYVLLQAIEKMKEERVDAVVISGDIYDKSVPSAAAVQLFNTFMEKLTDTLLSVPVMIISGNHDSAERMDCFRSILCKEQVYMVGMPPKTPEEFIHKVTVSDRYGNVNFYLLPFVKPAYVRNVFEEEVVSYEDALVKLLQRESLDTGERNVFVGHQFYVGGDIVSVENPDDGEMKRRQEAVSKIFRSDSEVITVGNIDSISVHVLDNFDYAALGHIHKSMTVGRETVRYCGTPMQYSVSEAGQEKGFLIVDLKEKGNVSVKKIPLVPRHQIRKLSGMLDDVLKEKCDDYVSVVLEDGAELDTMTMHEKLRSAFPRLLEVRRSHMLSLRYEEVSDLAMKTKNPYEMFCDFFPGISEEEKEILKDVINEVKEEA